MLASLEAASTDKTANLLACLRIPRQTEKQVSEEGPVARNITPTTTAASGCNGRRNVNIKCLSSALSRDWQCCLGLLACTQSGREHHGAFRYSTFHGKGQYAAKFRVEHHFVGKTAKKLSWSLACKQAIDCQTQDAEDDAA